MDNYLRFVGILVVLELTAPFSLAESDDPAIAAKDFVHKHLSDPNTFLLNPPQKMNPYQNMSQQEIHHLRQKTNINGHTLIFYPNGMPRRYASWRNQKLHGLMQDWYPSGVVMTREHYQQGIPMEGLYYNAAGVKLGEIKEGRGLKFIFETSHRDNSWLVATVEYNNGLKDGAEISYRDYQTKQKSHEAYYKEGKRHGVKTTWMSSGQKNSEEHYKHGMKHGKSINWHKNGQIQSASEYQDGKLVRPGIMYHENGQIKSVYECDQTNRIQQLKEYYRNGQIKSISDYNEDTSVKAEVQYYKDGTKAEQMNDKGHDNWFPSGQLMYSIKKGGRWGKVYSGESFDLLGNPNGKLIDGNGSLIKTFISDVRESSTLTVYEKGRTKKTIRLPKIDVGLGYKKGESRIDLKLKFTNSVNGAWEKGRFTVMLPEKCTSDDKLVFDISQLAAGQNIKFSWIDIKIPQKVEEWPGKIIADIEGVIEGHSVKYQQVLYNSKLKKERDNPSPHSQPTAN